MKKALLFALVAAALRAEDTRAWRVSDFEDFEKGTAVDVSLSSDGAVSLAPRREEILDASAYYLRDLTVDSLGTVYVAAGPDAKIFRVGPDGEQSEYFSAEAVEFTALALDARETLYAATSPEAKIYKIDGAGKGEVFYDPDAVYVWDMVFGPDDALYVATGDRGEIHRVEPSGAGSLFYASGERHVRSLAFTAAGDLIAGADPSGVILRISTERGEARGFVLHQSSRREITAVAVAPDGMIYAAAAGARGPLATAPTPVAPPPADPSPNPAANAPGAPNVTAPTPQPTLQPTTPTLPRGGSSIVRVAPDGEPREIWSSADAVVYSLGFDRDGKLLLGTGDDGRLYRVESEFAHVLATRLPADQITALALDSRGRVLAATSNVGKVHALGPEPAAEGSLESEVLDVERFSRFGRLAWSGQGAVEIAVRSGNTARPGATWSDWSPPISDPEGAPSGVPGARFAQWRATLRSTADPAPRLDSVTLYHQPKNQAPRVTAIELTPPNFNFPPRAGAAGGVRTVTLPPLGQKSSPPARRPTPAGPRALAWSAGALGVRWTAEDPNDDDLQARVELRGEGESRWITLTEDIEDPEFSWDSTAFADGRYRLRVTVSDKASNTPDEALEGERLSEPFLIDNGAPRVEDLAVAAVDGRAKLRFRALDDTSRIASAEYSIDGRDWLAVKPTNGLFDHRELTFDIDLGPAGEGERVVAARVADERENTTVRKIVAR